MADELVRDYWLNYKPATETVRIWISTKKSGWQLVNELPIEKAVFLSDMLRNEKPVFWIPGNVSLHTRGEPVGEEET
ncbi:MAG: hypothetical protein QNJ45_28035 [Ardenticatenaceae bacterium]|nr:hypothetical protein [Ardenticatenaceae bacterium]